MVQDNEARADNLIKLLPLLQSEEQKTLLPEAVTAARGIQREDHPARALAKLMPYLTSPQRRRVFDEIRLLMGRVTANWRMKSWKEVAESLPMPEREQLAQEEFETYTKQRVGCPLLDALVTLIPFLPEKVKLEAIIASLQVWTNEHINDYELEDLSCALPLKRCTKTLSKFQSA